MPNQRRSWLEDGYTPPDMKYVSIIDGFRVISIFIVAWFHIWQQSWLFPMFYVGSTLISLDPLVRSGYIFVDFLLLISGFLLYLPYARAKVQGESSLPSVEHYYVKRALRILPCYLLCVLGLFLFEALPKHLYYTPWEMWQDLLSHLTFTHIFWYSSYVGTRLNGVLWTLAVEVQFYLIFPVIARLFHRWPIKTYFALVAIAVIYRQTVMANFDDTNLLVNQLPAFFDVYANGMMTALAFTTIAKRVRYTPLIKLACSLGALLLLFPLWMLICRQASSLANEGIRIGQMQIRFGLSAIGSGMILLLANAGKVLRTLMGSRVMRFLSVISFNYYIWHQFIAVKMCEWGLPYSASPQPNLDADKPWQWAYTLCAFGFPLIVSVVLTFGFERPIARYGARKYKTFCVGRSENNRSTRFFKEEMNS